MNIFFLDYDMAKAAQYHCDDHCVKMIMESAQMLSTCHHYFGSWGEGMLKPTHINHPCNKWIRENTANYVRLRELFVYLSIEYKKRYNKDHAYSKLIPLLFDFPKGLKYSSKITKPALAMPNYYKTEDPVQSYRNFYIGDKAHFAEWKYSEVPKWWPYK